MTENHKKTILLVDDEVIIAMAEASTLGKHGYMVLVAHSGEEAIKTASGQPVPDLILMDIDLGRGMDGTQAAAIILEHLDIPVLFLSSHIEPEVVDKTEKINSYGYVVKNSGETVLLASIRMAFKLHAANLEIKKREDDLRKSEKKFSLIFENTPNAITITDSITGIVVDANKGIEWTGWSRDEIIGKSPGMLQSWVNPDEGEKIRAIIKEKGKLVNHRVSFYKKDHTIVHALMNSAIIQMDGKPYLLTTSNDITRVVKSDYEVNRAKEDLEGANEELNATIEELEGTNEELQATNQELEESKNDLETLLEEHKKALKELGEKEYFLRKSQEIGRIGSFTLEFPKPGQQEHCLHSSPAMDDIIGIDSGYSRNQDDWVKLLVEPEKVVAYLDNVIIAKKAKFDFEYQIKRPCDGEVRWMYGQCELINDDQGAVIGMMGTAQDITDRKHADEAIRLSEERYRAIFEQSATANIITAADTTIMLANSKFTEITGYSREEMEGKMSWTAFVVPEDLERMKRFNAQRRSKGGTPPQSYEFKGRIRSGEIRDFFMNVTMVPGTTESMAALIDITERVQAEERFSELTRYLPETVFETDLQGRITFVNEPSLARFGYTREEFDRGLTFLDIIVPEDHQRGIENYAKVLKGELFGLVEYTARKKDGTRFPVLINTSVIVRAGRPVGLRGFLVDITEQKRAEHAILEERTFTDAVLDSVPGLLYLYDDEGHLHRWNKSHETLTGYSKEELGGMRIFDWFKHDEKDLATIKAGVERAFRDGYASAEGNLMTKSGTTIPYYFTARLLEIRGRRYITGIGIDITERKRAEQALRESEERWQFALEGAGDGVWDWNAQSNKAYFSPQWKAMLGYEDHEIGNVFSEWDSRLHPDDRDTTYRELNRHLEGATPVYVSVHRLRCKNGEYRWILARGKVLTRTPDGKPLRIIGTHTDITERKQNEERYSMFLQAALDGFISCDENGHIFDANLAYCQMIGYPRDELLRMSVSDIEANLTAEEVVADIRKIILAGSKRFETRHRRKDGKIIDVEVSVRVLEHEKNRLFVFIRDITGQKTTSAALENSLHEKEALLLELQHRVKNSLAMITSLISLEMERPENDASRVILENLRGRIDSMASLYSLLIKSESATRVNLGDYIDAIITSLADTYLSGTSAIAIKKQFDHIPTDAKSAAAWGLITNELLTNALKYAFPQGSAGAIMISLRRKKDVIELAVSDTGAGPPADFDIENPKGFGTLLVKMLTGQLKGSFSFDRRKKVNVFSVRVPAPPGD